jgi:gas vesicle protein
MADRPRTCREYLSDSFRASAVAEQAVKNHVGRIRKKYSELMEETDADKRRTLLNELNDMKRELRKVKEYIG